MDSAAVISLALTPLTVVASAAVIVYWFQGGLAAASKRTRTDVDWLILGVLLGFAGSLVDNIYWGIYWSMDYVGSPKAEPWLSGGPLNNAVWRQAATIAAALCHLRAAHVSRSAPLRWACFGAAVGGIVLVWLLH